jgi:hypothetical protein
VQLAMASLTFELAKLLVHCPVVVEGIQVAGVAAQHVAVVQQAGEEVACNRRLLLSAVSHESHTESTALRPDACMQRTFLEVGRGAYQ